MVSTHATHKGKILQIRKKEEYEVNKVYPRRAQMMKRSLSGEGPQARKLRAIKKEASTRTADSDKEKERRH